MHTANHTQSENQKLTIEINIDELHIRLRNCKTPMVTEGQSVDYAAIRASKKVPRRILQTRTHLRKEVVNLHAMKL
jgi:hypothetical protein